MAPAGNRSDDAAVAEILSVGMVTPVGSCTRQTAAALRASIARLKESYLEDQYGEPIVMGLLDDEALPPLNDELENARLPAARRRLLRMAAPALDECLAGLGRAAEERPPALLLGAPEPRPDGTYRIVDVALVQQLALQAGWALDLARCQVRAQGRASGLLALHQALAVLARGEATCVLVGGVDSYLDAPTIAGLDAAGRLPNGEVQDGFVPGEAAAFLAIASPGTGARLGIAPLARVLGVGLGREPGHLYSEQPYLGEGLAQAFADLFNRLPRAERVRTLYAGLNGESFWAKELGVARIRNDARFEEPVRVEHPADAIGDVGAAMGPVMLGLAAHALSGRYRAGPALVYAGSDREERAAALLAG